MQVYYNESGVLRVLGLEDWNKELTPQEQDLTLVEAAVNGDCRSFTELCHRYYPAMVALAHSVLGDRHLAEDAAQQAFAKAIRKLPQLREKGQFAAWLAVICRNTAKDMARDTQKFCTAEDLSAIPAKSGPDEQTEIVKEAICELPALAKEVIFLRYYDGMTYERISAVLGISEQAINGRLRRAKEHIAHYLRRNGFNKV